MVREEGRGKERGEGKEGKEGGERMGRGEEEKRGRGVRFVRRNERDSSFFSKRGGFGKPGRKVSTPSL